jgi:hypothetical protein
MFCSGYPREALIEQGSSFADSVILTKPYGKAELAVRLREALAASSAVVKTLPTTERR